MPHDTTQAPASTTDPTGTRAAHAAVGAVGARSRHTPEQLVKVPLARHHAHAALHTGPPGHALPHMPQLLLSVRRSRHTPEQLVVPVPHDTAGTHRWSTPARWGTRCRRRRSGCRSVCRSRHTPEQLVEPAARQRARAVGAHLPRRARAAAGAAVGAVGGEVAADARAVGGARARTNAQAPLEHTCPAGTRGRRRRSWRGRW
jgi:hypothetical protein